MIIVLFFLFFLACAFSFYIPGFALLSFVKKKFTSGEEFLLSWPLGVAGFIIVSYTFAWAKIPFAALTLPAVSLLYILLRKRQNFFSIPSGIDWWSIVLILAGSLSFSVLTVFSGFLTTGGVTFYDVNRVDGLVHLALIKNMTNAFPPLNPSLAEQSLRGYHYFYDFLLSRFALFYHFSPRDLEFRFFPIFISLLFGLSFLLFSSLFTRSKINIRFILFFAYFGENVAFIYTLFSNHTLFGDIGFPFTPQLLLDPSVIISIPLFLTGLFFLAENRKNVYTALLSGLCLGILSEVKVYAGLMGIGILVLYSLYSLFADNKNWKWNTLTIAITGFLTILTFFPNNLGAGTLVFAPFLSYNHFISQPVFDVFKWQDTVQIYLSHNNFLHVAVKYFQAIALFWILVLGIRVLGLVYIKDMFNPIFWQEKKNVFLLFVFFVPLVLGSLFIQTVSVFDIMQFFWILVAIFAIPSGIAYAMVFKKLSVVGKVVLMVFVFAFSIIPLGVVYYTTFVISSADTYSQNQILLLHSVGKSIPTDSFIAVIPPYDSDNLVSVNSFEWYREPVVAAFTGRSTYFEPAIAYYHMYSSLYAIRQQEIFSLTKDLEACAESKTHDLLADIGTSYVISFTDYPCIGHTKETIRTASADTIHFYQFR